MNLRDLFRSPKHRQAVRELHAALKKARPHGIDVPADDAELATVAQMLLKDQPELMMVKTGAALTLYYRDDLDPTLSRETKTALSAAGLIQTKDTVHNG